MSGAGKGLLMLLGKGKPGEAEEDTAEEDAEGSESDKKALGQALLDAVKEGDAMAVYEAACAIAENEG